MGEARTMDDNQKREVLCSVTRILAPHNKGKGILRGTKKVGTEELETSSLTSETRMDNGDPFILSIYIFKVK